MPLEGQQKKNYENARSRWKQEDVRDIGPPPAVENPERRESCRLNLREYLLTYHGEAFPLAFSEDHEKLIEVTQKVILDGGQFVVAMPRGSGKTTIFQHAQLWASLYGHRTYTMLLCADDKKFKQLLSGIKKLLEANNRLLADFPEVIHPIRCLDRIALRAAYQTCEGSPTYMKWGNEQLVFPVTKYTKAAGNAGVVVGGGGITGAAVRGAVATLPDGTLVRPSCVLIDDPQTRKSAKSASQCQEREDICNGDILGMAGPGKAMAAMCAVTVIYQQDLADRLLDKDRSPAWEAMRVSMIKSWPKNMDAWEKYDTIRRQELYGELPQGAANNFYVEHREKLDEGAKVYWEERVLPGRVSALQSAMDDYFSDMRSFMAEKQNAPESQVEGDLAQLNPLELVRRVNGYRRGEVPAQCHVLTAHVDVQGKLLYWMVVAWAPNFAGYVVDYGTTPEQTSRNFTLANVRRGLQHAYPGTDEGGALRAAICDITDKLGNRVWIRDDGAEVRLTRGLVDSRWKTEDVHAALKLSKASQWLPAYGVGIRARDLPMAQYARRPGTQKGHHWIISKPDKRLSIACSYDTNYWKTETHQALSVPIEHTQSLSFYKAAQSHHQLLADQICAERAVRVEARGRIVDEWENTSRRDNHWFDTLVGCRVAASLCGIRKEGETNVRRVVKRPAKRVSTLKT